MFASRGRLYRQINHAGREDYERLVGSGLRDELVAAGRLIPHREVDDVACEPSLAYKTIEPDRVGFVSYPYEWSFSALQDAALLTIELQRAAIKRGMSLKDASAFNVQFIGCRPVHIDTLSFEVYREGEPWAAYGQFCRHFLAPLALMSITDARLGRLCATHLDGVPLDLACRILPWRTRLAPSLAIHLHLHARLERNHAPTQPSSTRRPPTRPFSRVAMLGLIDHLEAAVRSLRRQPRVGAWGDYYDDNSYSNNAFDHKQRLVRTYLQDCKPAVAWDLGANKGLYSEIASKMGVATVAFESDLDCVDANYVSARGRGDAHLTSLALDLLNPSPALGWDHAERQSLVERGPADVALALALMHHLVITGEIPMPRVAEFLARICRNLIIEFVPGDDPQALRLVGARRDPRNGYTRDEFIAAFAAHFEIAAGEPIVETRRELFRMTRGNTT